MITVKRVVSTWKVVFLGFDCFFCLFCFLVFVVLVQTLQTAREPGCAPDTAEALDVAPGIDIYFKKRGLAYSEPASLDVIFEHLIAINGVLYLIVIILCSAMVVTGNTITFAPDGDAIKCKQLLAGDTNGIM